MSSTTSETVIESLCRESFGATGRSGTVVAEPFLGVVKIEFRATDTGRVPRESTFVKLNWIEEKRDLWITQLHVAGSLRGRGWGRRLVEATERLAASLRARRIRVFPLHHARPFWRRVGYRPCSRVSRVMTKNC